MQRERSPEEGTDPPLGSSATGDLVSRDQSLRPTGFLAVPDGRLLPAPDSPPLRSAFRDGETVGGRYQIVRLIAEGGMGEVYEAQDLELRETVALKTIRPKSATDSRALDRFRREVLLARRVTHRNVCRLLEFGQHTSSDGSRVVFLTMELLRGQTLSARLRRGGPMSPHEALPVATQICAALDAAHKVGVVHRDFKGANVILVPEADGTVRAVVTDFGLAISEIVEGGASLASGGMLGTPAYMAPEQVRGRAVGPPADIYALGVVLYEMLTGHLPFEGDSPMEVAVQRLAAPPTPLRQHVPLVDVKWERTVLRCLQREPSDRFESATDVQRALEGGKPRVELTVGGRRGAILALVATTAAASVIFALAWLVSRGPAGDAPPSTVSRRSIAVLGFKNLSGLESTRWVSTAVSEMLGTELATRDELRVVPGESVTRILLDLAPTNAGRADAGMVSYSLDGLDIPKLRGALGAELVLIGAYLDLGEPTGGQISLDIRMQNATDGETLAAFRTLGTETKLADLVAEAGARVRRELDLEPLGPQVDTQSRSTMPSNLEATRLYAEGLDRLRRFDGLAARTTLERAVRADPQNPLIRSALAEAWAQLGYDARAAEEAERALALAGRISPEQRLLIEGRHAELSKDQDRAIEIYRRLFALFPDSLEDGLRLAAAQTAASDGQGALTTLAALRKLPAPASQDVRIDLAEAWTRTHTGVDGGEVRAQEVAARAAAAAKAQGLQLLAARALLWQAETAESRDAVAAIAAYEEARRTFEIAGDRAGVAQAMVGSANALRLQGELVHAKAGNEAAYAIYEGIGHKAGMALTVRRIAVVLGDQGQFEKALPMHERALALYREVGDRPGEAMSLQNLGTTMRRLGRLKEARERFDEALTVARQFRLEGIIALASQNLGRLYFDEGQLREAMIYARAAFNYWESQSDLSGAADALSLEGQALLAQGDLEGAAKNFQDALVRQTRSGDTPGAAETRMKQAAVAYEEERFAEAEVLARESAEEFSLEQNKDFEAAARAHLARALARQGKRDDAGEQAAKALALCQGQRATRIRLMVEITVAPVLAASTPHAGDQDAARRQLESVLVEATSAGYVALILDARLALAKLDLQSGREAEARASLESLQRDAAEHGYVLVARKAAAILR